MTELLKGNKDQQKAIILNRGPALILAGPGSGKTFTIVERIRYLITHHGVEPENILVITFTKAAARQMRERFQTRMGGMACPVNFGTFHAVFYHILKSSAPHHFQAVLSEKDKIEYLQRVLLLFPVQSEADHDFPADDEWKQGLLGEFGYVKNAGRMPEDFHSAYLEESVFKRMFLEFQRMLVLEKRMDFDDFAAHCRQLFRKQPQILAAWQDKFRYILVDEFQDINPAQYEVVKMLAGEEKNLFVVGDDDQSIYGFRASDPSIMKKFLSDFPEAEKILLSVNYRCAPGVVETAGTLIGKNKNRFIKEITAGKEVCCSDCPEIEKVLQYEGWDSFSKDSSVRIGAFPHRKAEMEQIRETILKIRQSAEAPPSVAAIFRTNTDALLLAETLSGAGIPFFLAEKIKSPYNHFVCQDLLAYLRFVFDGQKRGDFYRIMNKPARYLSRQAVLAGAVQWDKLLSFYNDKNWMHPYIRRMQADTERIVQMDLYAAVHYIRKGVGYDQWICQNLEGEKRKDALLMADFFKNSVRDFLNLEQLEDHIREYGKQLEKAAGKHSAAAADEVALLTMHGAKGLEFDYVFLPDCNEGIIPHKKSMKGKDVEEERRMFYVGMTRAKERLYIGWVEGTAEDPGLPSMFLGDMGYGH